MILPSLGLFWCLTCLGDAVTYCDINFFNFWTFLRNCDTGAIQSKTSQVIRSDVSSHIESDMDICFEKNWTICWAGALGGIARAELPSPLEQKKGLARPHGRTQTRYHTFGSDFEFLLAVPNMVPYADILKVFLMAQVFGWEGGCLWDESWSQNLFGSFWHFKVFQTLHMHCHYTRPTLLDSFLFYSILTLRPWSPLSMFHTWKWFYVRKGWKKKAIHRNVRFCCLKQTATAAWSPWMNGAMSNEASWVPSDGPGVWPNPPRRHGSWKCAPFRKILEYV